MDRFEWSDGSLNTGETLVEQQTGVCLYDGHDKDFYKVRMENLQEVKLTCQMNHIHNSSSHKHDKEISSGEELLLMEHPSHANGFEVIEWMKLAVEKRSELEVKRLLECAFVCKTNRKYFKQESAYLMHAAVIHGADNVIPHLVQAGAQRYNLNSYGDSDILLAIRHKQVGILKALLNFKQNINSKNRTGHFPLFLAANFGLVDAVKLLVEAGANVNMKLGKVVKRLDHDYLKFPFLRVAVLGDTVAHLIVRSIGHCDLLSQENYSTERHCQMLNFIFDGGFCKSVTNSNGHTLFDEVILNRLDSSFTLFSRLISDRFPIKLGMPMSFACRMHPSTSVYVFEALEKQYGTENFSKMVNAYTDTTLQPLHLACDMLNAPAVEWLLQHGANPNSTSPLSMSSFERCVGNPVRQSTNLSSMHIAASRVRLSSEHLSNIKNILQLLIEYGANVNAKNSDGSTPLTCALFMITRYLHKPTESLLHELLAIILLLLQAGANSDMCFCPSQKKPPKLILQSFTENAHVVMMILEMSTAMARTCNIEDVNKCLSHLSSFVPNSVIEKCIKQPRSLMVLCRDIVLQRSRGRHLSDMQKHFWMLPARLQDYLCMTYMLDPQWYIDQGLSQAEKW